MAGQEEGHQGQKTRASLQAVLVPSADFLSDTYSTYSVLT